MTPLSNEERQKLFDEQYKIAQEQYKIAQELEQNKIKIEQVIAERLRLNNTYFIKPNITSSSIAPNLIYDMDKDDEDDCFGIF